jgi:hypothetical protein
MQPSAPDPRSILTTGQVMMIVAGLGMIASILIAYPLADRFSLGVQIAGHLALPVAAAVFKLGYVVILAAQPA